MDLRTFSILHRTVEVFYQKEPSEGLWFSRLTFRPSNQIKAQWHFHNLPESYWHLPEQYSTNWFEWITVSTLGDVIDLVWYKAVPKMRWE